MHHPEPTPDLGVELDETLTTWAARSRVEEAAAARRRRGWLRRQAGESMSLAGVLLDAAERGESVTLDTRAGARIRGRLAAVGADACHLVDPAGGPDRLVATAAVAAVTTDGTVARLDDRPRLSTPTLAGLLTDLAAEGTTVTVHTAGGAQHAGRLTAVGADVVSLRCGRHLLVHVPLDAVEVVDVDAR